MKLAHLLLQVDGDDSFSSKQIFTILNRLYELELSYKCEGFLLGDNNDNAIHDNTIGPGKKGGEQNGGGNHWYSEVKSSLASGLTAALMRENKQRKAASLSILPSLTHTSLETSAFELLVGSLK